MNTKTSKALRLQTDLATPMNRVGLTIMCRRALLGRLVASLALAVGILSSLPLSLPFDQAWAQSRELQAERPSSKKLFKADTKADKKRKKTQLAKVTKPAVPVSDELNVKAPQVEFEKDRNVANASGGILVSASGNRIEADSGKVNLDTKEADVEGRVVLTGPGAQVTAESGKFNLDSETGSFSCAQLAVDEGAFRGSGGEVRKLSEDQFSLTDAKFTTCNCPDGKAASEGCAADGEQPWAIHANRVKITRDGYAHAYGSWIDFHGVPLLYTPYIGFPVKEQRQSGLLVPSLGYSNKDGFKAKVPLFVVLDESSDFLFSPFTESKTRTGLGFDYRQSFSRFNNLNSRFVYSNESARDGDLRGTNVQGVFAPYPDYQYFDDDRIAGYYRQSWRANPESGVPLSFVADGRYVGDRLVLREMQDFGLGDLTERDVTSTAVLRYGLGEFGQAELLGEFTQPLDDRDEDYSIQRLPELRASLQRSFRPFGYNPYGVKVVTQLQYLGDEFYRTKGYDGLRSHAVPSVGVPFHIANYLQGSVQYSYLRTDYFLDDTSVPNIPTEQAVLSGYDTLDSRDARNIGMFQARVGTALERVFSVDPDSWLTTVTALGAGNQANRLVRLKNTFEPSIRFMNIPDVDQDGLPNFDTLGRIAEKRVVSYGFKSSLYGRFQPLSRASEPIPELVPEVSDLPTAETAPSALRSEELFDTMGMGGALGVRNGEVREISRLVVRQAYDFIEEDKDLNPDRNAFSDIAANIYMMPTASFALGVESNYNQEDGVLDSMALSNHLFTDRGDALRARWTFVKDSDTGEETLSQIEGSLEVKLSERLRAGWYSRFDELSGTALQNHAVLRVLSSCNCWHLDLDYGQTENPSREQVLLRFTFSGLGDITAGTSLDNSSN